MEEIQEIEPKKKIKEKKFSILYVDDEETNLRVFKANFRKFFNVKTSANPFEAIEMLKEQEFQVIVTDQRMPEMTGTQFLEKILPDYPDVIKIILTGFTDIEAIQDGINRCGIFKYITKPWNFEEMKGVLERAVETYQEVAESEEHIKELEDSNVKLESTVKERNEEIKKINKQLIDSITYAGLLQKSMLPNDRYLKRQFSDHFVIYQTKYLFSEEFIWTNRLNFRSEDYTIVVVVEFDGKGIVGSLKTLISDSILNYLTNDRKIFSSGEIVQELERELNSVAHEDLKCNVSASVAIFDHNTNTLQFTGLNHDMMILDKNGISVLKGTTEDLLTETSSEKINIVDGAAYYMYSRGYYNQKNEDGVKFSLEKFEEMIKSFGKEPMSKQKELLLNTMDSWKSGNQLDEDMTIMAFKL